MKKKKNVSQSTKSCGMSKLSVARICREAKISKDKDAVVFVSLSKCICNQKRLINLH